MENIEIKGGGLKCDNPSCDWKDMTIPIEDLDKYLNKECPKCGENVLTQVDLDNAKRLHAMVDFINSLSPEQLDKFNSARGATPLDDLEDGTYSMTVNTHEKIQITDLQRIGDE